MADALLVASSFLPGRGGIESYLADLSHHVRPRLAVLAQHRRDGRPMPANLGYPVTTLATQLRPTPSLARSIVETARTHGTDKVLFGSAWPLPLVAGSLRRNGLRYGIIVHGAELFIPASLPVLRSRLRSALRGADVLFPISAYTEGRMRQFTSQDTASASGPVIRRMRVIVDPSRFDPDVPAPRLPSQSFPMPAAPRIVLHVGRLVKRKGIDRLLRAFPQIVRRVPDAVLVVAGTGPEEAALRKLADRLQVPAVFLGSVAEADIPPLYAAAEVFVLPVADRWFGYEFEGLGIVLLEAAASETPSVVGRSGGTPEAVVDGETGFVIDGRDVGQIVDRVVVALSDDDLRKRMGAAARDYVRRTFSPEQSTTALSTWMDS